MIDAGRTATAWQEGLIADLATLQMRHPGSIRGLATLPGDGVVVGMEISTAGLPRRGGGLRIGPWEPVLLHIPRTHLAPPLVFVPHERFVGYPHVLEGNRPCVYLDPDREWDPGLGAAGVMDRIVRWFGEAASGSFDPTTALYHPVGGVLHARSGTPTFVCRAELVLSSGFSSVAYVVRGDKRVDLVPDAPEGTARATALRVGPLPLGAGNSISEICARTNRDPKKLRRVLERRTDATGYAYLVLHVEHPQVPNGHILVGRVRVLVPADQSRTDLIPELEWCHVSDERPSISTRRDDTRPMARLRGMTIVLLGCGGLGSWIAEFAARAAVRAIVLSDPGYVTGGLLVRQNYTETDIGQNKAEALAARLQRVADDVEITTVPGGGMGFLSSYLKRDDVIVIDATVNTAVARELGHLATSDDAKAMIGQVATDVGSGSLGLVTVAAPGGKHPAVDLDKAAGVTVRADPALEPFHTFWNPSEEGELTPTRGCSVPTFHGSAADLAAIAGEHLNLVARHVGSGISATHLFALPHTGISPSHRAVSAPEPREAPA